MFKVNEIYSSRKDYATENPTELHQQFNFDNDSSKKQKNKMFSFLSCKLLFRSSLNNWKKKKFRKWNCWHRCRIVRVLCCSRKLSLSNTKRCYYNRRFGWWMLLATCANRSFFNDFSRAHDHTRQSTNVVRRCQSLRVLRRIWCYSGEFYLLNVSKTKQKKNMKFSKKKNSTIRQQLQIQLDRTMLNCLLIIIQQILHHIVQQLELLDFGMYGFFKKYFLAVTFSQ